MKRIKFKVPNKGKRNDPNTIEKCGTPFVQKL